MNPENRVTSAIGVTQSRCSLQWDGGWEGKADYTCQINAYRFTDERLRKQGWSQKEQSKKEFK